MTSIEFALANALWIPAYCRALREGFRRRVQAAASESDVASIETDPDGWLDERLQQKGKVALPDGSRVDRVPHALLWMLVDGRFVGEASLRWKLGHGLEIAGGHIGYGIHPAFHRQGFGKELLRRTLAFAKQGGLDRVLITAASANVASWRLIEACGGKFDGEVYDEKFRVEGELVRRYWIEL